MSWAKARVRKASDVVKPGETVEAVILGMNVEERRISLGLKQALGDPWVDVPKRFPVGSEVEGPVTSLMKFGAFVQLSEGVEGMIHVSEISADKRIGQPAEVLRVGQIVKALVLGVDPEKRQIKLSMKQLVATGIDEYLAEHKQGDVVTGRLTDESGTRAELGEGIFAECKQSTAAPAKSDVTKPAKADLSSLSSMLQARWKTGAGAPLKAEPARAGQVRSFRIVKLDPGAKKIEVELA
jgi:small subunit ribosomal protein S1